MIWLTWGEMRTVAFAPLETPTAVSDKEQSIDAKENAKSNDPRKRMTVTKT